MWYWFFKLIFWAIFKLFFRFKVEGLKNLPPKTNFIVVANHASYLDSVCIMAALPRRIYCIVARFLYRIPVVNWFLRSIKSIPSGNSSARAVDLLVKHKNVGLFPEGGISRDGSLGEFRRGLALLAIKTGRPIIPCAVLGAYQALPFQAKFPKLFSPIKVKIGKPVYLLKEFDDEIDDIYLQEGVFKIRDTIKEMLNAG